MTICIVEKIKTHILFSVTSSFFENLAVYEVLWKNILEPEKPQMTVERMPIACRIPKATKTHSEYVIVIVFLLQQWKQESGWL